MELHPDKPAILLVAGEQFTSFAWYTFEIHCHGCQRTEVGTLPWTFIYFTIHNWFNWSSFCAFFIWHFLLLQTYRKTFYWPFCLQCVQQLSGGVRSVFAGYFSRKCFYCFIFILALPAPPPPPPPPPSKCLKSKLSYSNYIHSFAVVHCQVHLQILCTK